MANKTPQAWKNFFLPKTQKIQWTWQMIFLTCVAAAGFIDSFFVSSAPDLDPGSSGESFAAYILAIRAVSRRELSTPVMLAGTCLAVLNAASNRRLLRTRNPAFLALYFALLLTVVIVGRPLKPVDTPVTPDEKSVLKTSAKD